MPQIARIAEIDCFRGIALLLMILFHLVFDLAYFYNWSIDYLNGFWYYLGKAAAILFMLVSGISNTLSRNPIRRGLTVFSAGMLITVVTYYYNPAMYIRFGILHLLGFGMLTTPWLTKLSALLLILAGTTLLVMSNWTANLMATSSWLLPLGITPTGFASLDYYPLFPWLGVVLYGLAIGKLLYGHKQPCLSPSATTSPPARILSWLGRQSLLIYLVHQPIILALLLLLLQ